MRILVDADGCPVVDIVIKVASLFNGEVILVTDTSHILYKDHAETIVVDKGRDSVDFALVNRLLSNDIVVTQDYGVAAMALAKKAYPINQNGLVFTEKNIDTLLLKRHISKEIRNAGGKTPNMKKRKKEQDIHFEEKLKDLCRLIDNKIKGND